MNWLVTPTGLLAIAVVLTSALLFCLTSFASAQGDDLTALLNRMARLERDVQALNRQLAAGSGGGKPSGVIAETSPAALARFEVRLTAVEQELRQLTGRLGEINHQTRQLQQRLDTTLADVQFRLQHLEPEQGLVADGRPRSEDSTFADEAPTSGSEPLSAGEAGAGAPQPKLGPSPLTSTAPSAQTLLAPSATTSPSSEAQAGPRAEEQYAYAFGLLRKAQYPEAEAALETFLQKHSGDPLADNARYWLAETYYVRGNFIQAAESFLEAYQKNKEGPKAADALLKLGMSLAQLDKKQEACATFQELKRSFPSAPTRITKKANDEQGRLGCK